MGIVRSKDSQATFLDSLCILGREKVILPRQTAATWGMISGLKLPGYSIGRLEIVAEENESGNHDNRLVCLHGLSLIRQYELRGSDCGDLSRFSREVTWWLDGEKGYFQHKNEKSYWAENSFKSGCYLVDVYGAFGSMTWDEQERAIREFPGKRRCFEEVLCQVILTVNAVTHEKICCDWVHPGRFVNSDGNRVTVFLSENGLCLGTVDVEYQAHPDLKLALFHKFEYF